MQDACYNNTHTYTTTWQGELNDLYQLTKTYFILDQALWEGGISWWGEVEYIPHPYLYLTNVHLVPL